MTRSRFRLLAVLWTLGILAACTVPGSTLPSITLFEFDKFIHFALFFGFGALWLRALPPTRRHLGWVLLGGVAFAIGTEFYQGLLPWPRYPDLYDALANLLGLGAALFLFRHRQPTPA